MSLSKEQLDGYPEHYRDADKPWHQYNNAGRRQRKKQLSRRERLDAKEQLRSGGDVLPYKRKYKGYET